ncbi:MAG: glycosyltransferase [Kiritimatiellae bacterium]|nr:glycosyltransferase [Kiritimatiellia bacterium]
MSVVVPTRNEEANIGACIGSFAPFRDDVELIVVDNGSTDATRRIAGELGAKVLEKGPERSAQRNLGWRTSSAAWVVVLDADMILPRETVEAMLDVARRPPDASSPAAYWIPEVRTGRGLRTRARNFERSFYDGTCIDALRLFRRDVLEATGGYDEALVAGPEDWELDIRVLATGANCAVLGHHLVHNEKRLSLRRMLEKKAYYSKSMAAYRAKWKGHPAVAKQFGIGYRFFWVFVERGKWRRLLRHPVLAAVMYFERIAVGLTYLVCR